jgi:hypothetical protein
MGDLSKPKRFDTIVVMYELFSGVRPTKSGYDGFVEMSQAIMRGRTPSEQKEAVLAVLNSLLPWVVPWATRTFFRPTELTCFLCAFFAHIGFVWVCPLEPQFPHLQPELLGCSTCALIHSPQQTVGIKSWLLCFILLSGREVPQMHVLCAVSYFGLAVAFPCAFACKFIGPMGCFEPEVSFVFRV